MRSLRRTAFLLWGLSALWGPWAQAATEPASIVPAAAPRTNVLAGRHDAFRAYCTTGEGAKAFAKLKADLDAKYLALPFPAEPVTYGDPAPSKRTSAMADQWRAVQDTCGVISAVAEAASLCWIVTGEEKYLTKARDFLLGAAAWHFAPDWKSGAVVGATDIYYNDEAHFRLWRKLPLVYDQLRDQLTPAEKSAILAHFRERGRRSVEWIEHEGNISQITRNSIAADLSSHPVRFMPMTGLTALALWDDLPEARDWWTYAYQFYRDQFSPWGGDDGGWGEGTAYWRGTFEHAAFQDALLALGDPAAYASPFWRNSPLFAVYHVQPYLHTTFGDTSNAGRFNLEPVIADYMEHLARVQQNGFLRTYAELCTDRRPRPIDKGLDDLSRTYPTAAEFLVRNFIASAYPLPAARPLNEPSRQAQGPEPVAGLPPQRHFADVGWVSLHSALGDPANDIHVTFKSSPYGSFSHSHADQNSFILNAYGEGLAINSAYREFHNSPHHRDWTRQTISKNTLLIDGLGQKAQSKDATGRITRFETGDRYVLTTGDATAAYQTLQPKGRVQRVTRDLVFIDQRYLVLRDRVELATPGKLSWLLHGEKGIEWLGDNRLHLEGSGGQTALQVKLVSPGVAWQATVTDRFPVPVDPKYASGEISGSYLTGKWHNQTHLTLESTAPAQTYTVYAVLFPYRSVSPEGAPLRLAFVDATLTPDGSLAITHGGTEILLTLTDDSIQLR
ncbi:Heparinase II/III-like protein [Lacunisphaera limnophila]|uniref:Heparinase II/III-like protein n=1 Tax=Lacunisphaera limnophila TaxID=1838286 RepID=A0A1D8ATI5_9BACT|nr:heparinase II/III family protein [Lacunisphaera limnophila]AOS44201.1 Heparinase II/III-like protein [Lacunisphaera limnophila]